MENELQWQSTLEQPQPKRVHLLVESKFEFKLPILYKAIKQAAALTAENRPFWPPKNCA